MIIYPLITYFALNYMHNKHLKWLKGRQKVN